MKAGLLLLLIVAVLATLLGGATRVDPHAVPTPAAVFRRTMSPFCPGLTLEECPSEQATGLRHRISDKVASGANNRQIDDWLVSQYGRAVLANPPQVWAWLVPAGLALAGLAALTAKLSGRSPAGAASQDLEARAPEGEAPSGYEQQLRSRMRTELSQFRKGTE